MQQINNLFPFPNPADDTPAPGAKRAKYIAEHFPEVNYGGRVPGPCVLIQLRMVPVKTKGGIALPQQTRDFNEQQTTLGIIRMVGPTAFKDKDTGTPWKEGAWYKVGDLVMAQRYKGRRFAISVPGSENRVVFVICEREDFVDWLVDDQFDDLETLYDQII